MNGYFTSHDIVPGKEVPFGGLYDYILYSDPFSGPNLTGLGFFLLPKIALTWGCSNIKLPLIVVVAP